MTSPPRMILPLTSLRFIAALMIFILHTSGKVMIPDFKSMFGFGHGVSFFYVLSGFILTYVYFRPGAKLNLRRFFKKRFFRLYPLHIVTFIAVILFIPSVRETFGSRVYQIPFQLTLTQSWLGTYKTGLSFNGPAWSISTEFGFYILFPLLLKFYDRIYSIFLVSIGLTLAAILTANFLTGAVSDWLWEALHMHPLGRVMEFISGICAAKLFLQKPDIKWSNQTFTALEVFAFGLILFAGSLNQEIGPIFAGAKDAFEITDYLNRSMLFVAFACLIWVIAQEKGLLSQWLSNKTLVLLGEISFAFYLIHAIVIRFFGHHFELILGYHPVIIFTGILLISLGFSYVAYKLIEIPFQKAGRDGFQNVFSRENWLIKNSRAFAVLGLTLCFGVIFSTLKPGYQAPSDEKIKAFKADSILANVEVTNAKANLTHYRFKKEGDLMCYEMLWEFGEMDHGTPINRIVNISYKDRRKTILNEMILAPSAWKNLNDEKVYVMDYFCLSDLLSSYEIPDDHVTRITLRQKTPEGYANLKFKHNDTPQNWLLLNSKKPDGLLWRKKKKR